MQQDDPTEIQRALRYYERVVPHIRSDLTPTTMHMANRHKPRRREMVATQVAREYMRLHIS